MKCYVCGKCLPIISYCDYPDVITCSMKKEECDECMLCVCKECTSSNFYLFVENFIEKYKRFPKAHELFMGGSGRVVGGQDEALKWAMKELDKA